MFVDFGMDKRRDFPISRICVAIATRSGGVAAGPRVAVRAGPGDGGMVHRRGLPIRLAVACAA